MRGNLILLLVMTSYSELWMLRDESVPDYGFSPIVKLNINIVLKRHKSSSSNMLMLTYIG